MAAGWVYVLINPSMPGLVKVGQAGHDPESRASELTAATGVATPFTVVYKDFFSDAVAAERYAHTLLDGRRLNANREFFQVDATTAIKAVMSAPGHCEPADRVAEGDDTPDTHPALAIFEEAECYRFGMDDTVKNYDKAMRLYQQAASLGVTDAWIAIGDMYLYGEAGRENPELAAKCFHKAIDGGNYFGYARLAHALESIDIRESDKAWDIFFRKFVENPAYPTVGLSTEWYLASFVYRMALNNRTDIPARVIFTALRGEITDYIAEGARRAGADPTAMLVRALAWLEANP